MEYFLKKVFLAKNKYPDIITSLKQMDTEFEGIPIGNNTDMNDVSNIHLSISYLGITQKENLSKAEYWALQTEPSLISLCLLVIIYLRKMGTNENDYTYFINNYKKILDLFSSIDNVDMEYLYRFLHLLSGYVKENMEYEYSEDLLKISEWINSDIEIILIDKLINKWMIQKKYYELYIIKWIIGKHKKLDYILENIKKDEDKLNDYDNGENFLEKNNYEDNNEDSYNDIDINNDTNNQN